MILQFISIELISHISIAFIGANEAIGNNIFKYINYNRHIIAIIDPNDLDYFHAHFYNFANSSTLEYQLKGLNPTFRIRAIKRLDTIKNFTTTFQNRNQFIPRFTFVRDPMTRFEYGLSEAALRTRDQINGKYDDLWNVTSSEQVRYVIHEMFNFSRIKVHLPDESHPYTSFADMMHVYPMSGALFRFRVDVVGYLEQFNQDWNEKVAPLYQLDKSFDLRLGLHKTAVHHPRFKGNTFDHLRHFYRQLLSQEPQYGRAICHIMLIDYVCLPKFSLPPECQFLSEKREIGMKLLMS